MLPKLQLTCRQNCTKQFCMRERCVHADRIYSVTYCACGPLHCLPHRAADSAAEQSGNTSEILFQRPSRPQSQRVWAVTHINIKHKTLRILFYYCGLMWLTPRTQMHVRLNQSYALRQNTKRIIGATGEWSTDVQIQSWLHWCGNDKL
jgi:hypothetical protein